MNTRHTKNTWIVALAALSAVGNAKAQTVDNFESYSDGQALNDVNSWEWNGTVSATDYSYDTNKGYPISGSHTKVMDVNGVTGTLYSDSDESMTVFTDMIVKPGQFRTAAEGHLPISDQATMGFYVNENGHPVIGHQAYGTQNTVWTEITDVTLSPTEWHRVTVQLDYRPLDLTTKHLYFSVVINGELVTNAAARGDQTGAYAAGGWFPMISKNSFDGMYLKGASASVDDVVLDGDITYQGVQVLAASAYEPADGETTTADFIVRLPSVTTVPVTISYETADVSATAGQDYVATSGTVVIPAGSQQAVISVTVNGDAADDSDETFLLRVTGVENAVLDSGSDAVGTIIDDSGDTDYDGLTNGQEIALGTDPETADTDGDGFSDYIENLDGSDPLDGSSLPTNPINLAPYFAALESGKEYGYTIPSDQHEFTETYSGVGVTFRAFNSSDSPINLKTNTSGKFGAGGTTFKTGNYISITFDRDTYLDEIGFGSWAGSEVCQISGDAIAALNGIDDTVDNTFVHDPVAKTLQISGQPNPVALIDNVTGEGLLVPAGSEIRVTFLNGTASLGWLNFQPRISVSDGAAIGTLVQNMQSSDPNQNDVLTTEIIAGNDSGLFAVDNAGNVTVAGTLDYNTATEHTLTIQVTDLEGLVAQQDLKIYVTEFDTDNDGLEDAWEIANFGDLSRDGSGDFDNDGVSDLTEYNAGTNPTSSDTDNDGYDDYVELLEGSDPLDAASVASNTSNVAPFFAAQATGKLFGNSITADLHEHVETYNGSEVTLRAFNETGAATVFRTNASGKFGADSLKFRANDYVSISFDRDTYLTELGFGSWAGNEGCQISGDAVALWNGVDDTANNTFVHDPVAKTLVINGSFNPVGLVDNVTGQGLLVPAGSELQITFLDATASLGWLNFHERVAVSELAQVGAAVLNVNAQDANTNDVLTTEIVAGNDSGLFAIDANGLITVAGALDYETATSHTLTIRATDLAGLSTDQDFVIQVTNDNEDPTASDGIGNIAENGSNGDAVATVAASDTDGDTLSFAITAGNESGLFAIDSNGNITATAALDHETSAQYLLTVEVSDGVLTDTATITVNVTDVNEAPSASDLANSLAEGSAGIVGTVGASDPEGDNLSYAITAGNASGIFAIDANGQVTASGALDFETASQHVLTVEVSDGELTDTATVTVDVTNVNEAPVASGFIGGVNENLAGGQVLGSVGVADPDSGDSFTYAIVAGNAAGLFAIDTNGQITTTGSLDFETANAYALTVEVTDAAGLTDSANVTVTVGNVNEAPSASGLTNAVAENGSAGAVVGTVGSSDPDGDNLSYQITGGNASGLFAIDSNGQITTTGALDHEAASQHVLTVQVSDGEFSDSATVTVNVTDVNEAPTASNTSGSVAENASAGTVIGTMATSDPEGDNLSYQITAGNDSGLFAIDANGQITTTGSLDHEKASQYVLTVEVSDGALTDTATVTVDVTDVNEAPTASDISGSVVEDGSAGEVIGSVAVSDPEGDSVTYQITAGNESGLFAIDANGQVTTTGPLDYETATQHVLTIEVSDGELTDTATVTVNVTDVNVAPEFAETVTAFTTTGAVNGAADYVVTEDGITMTVVPESDLTDPDLLGTNGSVIGVTNNLVNDGEKMIFSFDKDVYLRAFDVGSRSGSETDTLTSSAFDGLTEIAGADTYDDATDSLTKAGDFLGVDDSNDYEGILIPAGSTIDFTVNAGASISYKGITVAAVNSATVDETISVGTQVASAVATDAEAGDQLSYAITAGNDSGLFAIDSNGAITTTAALDFATASSHMLTITATDFGGLSATTFVRVNVIDVNQAPVASDGIGNIAENGSNGDAVATVAAADADGDTLSFAITAGNESGAFAIDSNGNITATTALDHETAAQYILTVEVSDSEFANTATITVNVTDVNEAPIASNASGSVAENGSAGAVIGTVASSDPEGDNLTYQITSGNASGIFAIDANGQVTTTGALDFEAASQYALTVEVSDGSLTDTATVTANVTDVNEAPSMADNSASIAEDASVGTIVVSVSANDPDAGASLAYSITAGNTGNAFSIDTNGNVKVASALDYETTTSYNLNVQVSDGSLTDTAQVAVNVIDVVEVSVASIATGSASNVSMESAEAGYSITDDGNEAPTVTLYYGESDGGQSAGAWDNSTVIGTQVSGSYAEPLTGLTAGTEYFYTVSATNSAGSAWGSTANFTTEADTTPKLVRTTVSAVSNSAWTTVDLGQNYNSAVIVATPIYPAGTTTPVVTRIRNVSGSSFELKLDRADGQTAELNLDISVVAVEEGVYTLAADGVQMEAVKFSSTVTAENNNWSTESRSMQNSYTAPVVVGQVMSYNDANWSVFWANGNRRASIPTVTNFNAGKHVGEDQNATRADETVGYIVIESGSGSINGVAYEAAVGSKSIRGFGNNSNPYTYSLSGSLSSASAAAISSAGMASSNGGWSVLSGATPIEATSLDLHICEDQMSDTEQSHNSTQVGYLIFE